MNAQSRPAPTDMQLIARREIEAKPGALEVPSPSEPYRVAKCLNRELYTANGLPTLAYWRGDFWRHEGTHWELRSVLGRNPHIKLKNDLYRVLDAAVYEKHQGDGKATLVDWKPTSSKLNNTIDALMSLVDYVVPDNATPPMLAGDTGELPGNPGEFVAMENGLFHIPTGKMHPHTPRLFNTYCLPYAYDPNAITPVWSQFLAETFAHDPNAEKCLQEFAGYIISGRTDMHKALLMVGPRRAGKGTILRVLTQLVGKNNTVAPTLNSLGGDFGAWSLIGKPLAVIGDAREAKPGNNQVMTERLLGIIGEDSITVDRKGISPWSGKLSNRFVIASNELPRFVDASGAIVSRFMMFELQRSVEGNEDTHLGAKLSKEMPGIFNWALEGLKRLEEAGRFTVPTTMAEMTNHMHDAASTAHQFIEDCLEVTGNENDRVRTPEVYKMWTRWHQENGYRNTPNQATMCRNLRAASGQRINDRLRDLPDSTKKERKRARFVLGIKLRPVDFYY
ncbi:phage/plasmid primase, P4 family [Corynebacterium sp. ES2775-CONJ]|uniref:DNA primase family protein n=1 Tax=Corynebacterium sp. ES2775-CONJ TaxID=2974029 RepID=UPI00286DEA0F|nr:phage/plasmid primase, P4 family [Corynebacterium sp. ES2775-CONJ]